MPRWCSMMSVVGLMEISGAALPVEAGPIERIGYGYYYPLSTA
jgi:hypothetical protein